MSVFKRWNGTQWETIGPGVTSTRFDNINNMIAPEYDPQKTYNVGDYVVQSDKLYRCINRIGTPQAWNSENWREIKLGQDVTELRNDVVAVSDTQPMSVNNRIWVKPNNNDMKIPLVEDVMMLPNPNDYGENDQIPRSTGTGIEWVNYGLPSDQQTEDAINAWLNIHPEATTTVQDHSLTYEKLVLNTLGFVIPQMYGAKGDGITDDTSNIQQCIDENSFIFFPDGTYIIDGTIGLNLHSNLTILLSNNAILQRTTTDIMRVRLINGVEVENVIIQGGHIYGDLQNHDNLTDTEYQCHGIYFIKSNNIKIIDVEIAYHLGDAIYAGVGPQYVSNLEIRDCILHDVHRHGIAITGVKKGIIENCDIYGVYWLDGIDFESGYQEYGSENITINNLKIHDFYSNSYAIHLAIMNHDCTNLIINNLQTNLEVNIGSVDSSLIVNSTLYLVVDNQAENFITTIKQCILKNVSIYCLASNINFIDCIFNNGSISSTKHGNDIITSESKRANVCFNNCNFMSKDTYTGASDRLFYFTQELNSCIFNNCDILIRSNNQSITVVAEKISFINCFFHYTSNVLDAQAVTCALDDESLILQNCTIDASNISSTTNNGFITFYGSIGYIIGNTIISSSPLGGVYNGNAIRVKNNENTKIWIINNNFIAYYIPLNTNVTIGEQHIYGNVFQSDLNQ